jgi:uncharacterized protein YkwD
MIEHLTRRARSATARAAVLGGTALLGAAAFATLGATPATGWNQSSAEATLWQLTNGARANNGLRVLQQNGTLVGLARWRSKDEVQRNYFSHTILGTGYEVYHWYDTNGLRYRWGGENIGWNNGYADADSPVKIHEGFMASPGHRANILEPSWTHGGIGAFGADNVSFLGATRSPRFYTELFMQALSSAPAPPPPPPPGTNPPRPSGGGPTVTQPARVAPTPTPRHVAVTVPARPVPSHPLDGAEVVTAASVRWSSFATRALPTEAAWPRGDAWAAASFPSLRIEAASAADRGFVDAVIGGLLGFLIG